MTGEGTAATVPLLGPGLWTRKGPAWLVARPAGWMVLVPTTAPAVLEAAWDLLADPPTAREIPDLLTARTTEHPLTDLVVALHAGPAAIDLALLGTAPLAVHDGEGTRLLQGEEQSPRSWRLTAVRRLAFGSLPAEDPTGAPRLEAGVLGIRGLVHGLQDPAALEDAQREALAAEVIRQGRVIEEPAEAARREQRRRSRESVGASGAPRGAAPEPAPGRPAGAAGAGMRRFPDSAAAPSTDAARPEASGGPLPGPEEPGRIERLFAGEFAPLRRLRVPDVRAPGGAGGLDPLSPSRRIRAVGVPGSRPPAGRTPAPTPPGSVTAPAPARRYDELFGDTRQRRVEDAAVRPTVADAGDPSPAADTPTPPPAADPLTPPGRERGRRGGTAPPPGTRPEDAGTPPEAPGLIDRVPGIDRPAPAPHAAESAPPPHVDAPTALRDRPVPAPLPPRPAGTVVRVAARTCPLGHAEDPSRSHCRRCGTPLAGETVTRERPPLGRLVTTRGAASASEPALLLDRDAEIGRRPRGTRGLRVESPEQGLSRRHLAVRLVDWQVRISDLATLNGTVLHRPGQERRALPAHEEVLLEDGDRIVLGEELELTYREVP